MGLEHIWDDEGNYLKKNSKGFRTRSTGCSCCSYDLTTKEEVEKEAIDSLMNVLIASDYFKFNFVNLISEARRKAKKEMKYQLPVFNIRRSKHGKI